MRGLRWVLGAAAVSLVFVQGVRGAMLGLILLGLNELLLLRGRMHEPGTVRLRPLWLRPARRRAVGSTFPTFDPLVSEIMWSAQSRRDFDTTLRRRLTRIVEARLIAYDLDLARLARDPEQAARMLGPRLWPLVDPGRRMSGERGRGGINQRDLDRLLDDIDAIGRDRTSDSPRA
jgi:hypothetical protein